MKKELYERTEQLQDKEREARNDKAMIEFQSAAREKELIKEVEKLKEKVKELEAGKVNKVEISPEQFQRLLKYIIYSSFFWVPACVFFGHISCLHIEMR